MSLFHGYWWYGVIIAMAQIFSGCPVIMVIHDYQGIAILEFPPSGKPPERGDKDKTMGVSRSAWLVAVCRAARIACRKIKDLMFHRFPTEPYLHKSGKRRFDVILNDMGQLLVVHEIL